MPLKFWKRTFPFISVPILFPRMIDALEFVLIAIPSPVDPLITLSKTLVPVLFLRIKIPFPLFPIRFSPVISSPIMLF